MKRNKYQPKYYAKEPSEIERLTTALMMAKAREESLRGTLATHNRLLREKEHQLKDQRAELGKVRLDAARYRELRELNEVFVLDGHAQNLKGAELDRWLDLKRAGLSQATLTAMLRASGGYQTVSVIPADYTYKSYGPDAP